MSITPVQNNNRRYPRYSDSRSVRVKDQSTGAFWDREGTLDDISGGGASIRIDVPLHNNAFVDLHVQGVGPVKGSVVRAYEGGAAVSFDIEEKEKAKLANSLEVFHKNNRRGGY